MKATVAERGQVTIPKPLREKLGIRPGTRLDFKDDRGKLVAVKVSDEDPVGLAAYKQVVHRFHPPLDIVDGAARIVDPILHGVSTGEHVWGQFLKDYRSIPW